MATATPATAQGSPQPMQQTLQRLNALTQRQKMAAAAAVALAVSLVVGMWLWTRAPEYGVLFANLDERDGGAIVAALQQQNVAYRISPDGRALLVPSDMVHDIRLRLAAQGLPKGGMVGFEVMENQRLGVSQFLEQVNFQRALEGELSRTITSIASVASARVHLAIPKQSGFLRDDQKPSASVMVTLYPGRMMEPAQVAGIVHLIAASVPRMANEGVSVIDQNGNLLTNRPDPLRHAGLDATQLNYVREVEEAFVRRIENLLTPLVGAGNFRAQVTADVDFSQVEETAERYRPNPSPEQSIRSEQTSENITRDAGAVGVPGALTNQPPVPATAPIVAPDVANGQGGDAPINHNRTATINYELDRTIQHVRQAPGQIRRLSVAVVVNEPSETLANGQTRPVALSEEETTRITNLVREAMGFSAERGDSLNVSSAPFAAPAEVLEPELPIWKDPDMIDLGKELFKYIALLGALALVYFGVIRPLVRTVAVPPAKERDEDADSLEGDEEDALLSLSGSKGPSFEERLERARELAKGDPRAVANLIKEWLGATEEAKK